MEIQYNIQMVLPTALHCIRQPTSVCAIWSPPNAPTHGLMLPPAIPITNRPTNAPALKWGRQIMRKNYFHRMHE